MKERFVKFLLAVLLIPVLSICACLLVVLAVILPISVLVDPKMLEINFGGWGQ